MLIVKLVPNSNGSHANQMSSTPLSRPEGYVAIPPALEEKALMFLPWLNMELENGEVVGVSENTEAKQAFEAIPTPEPTTEEKIAILKQNLTSTDYQAIKFAEGVMSTEEYQPIKLQRQAWRDEINALEQTLAEIPSE